MSVASLFASAAGAGGLVERSVVDGLTEVDLPRLGSPASGVPRVQADEVVTDEGDRQEQSGGDESGLPEEGAVDAQPLVAVGADEPLDEGAPIETTAPPGGTLKGCPSTAEALRPAARVAFGCGTNRYGSRASKASRRRAFSAVVMPAVGASSVRWVSGRALE